MSARKVTDYAVTLTMNTLGTRAVFRVLVLEDRRVVRTCPHDHETADDAHACGRRTAERANADLGFCYACGTPMDGYTG